MLQKIFRKPRFCLLLAYLYLSASPLQAQRGIYQVPETTLQTLGFNVEEATGVFIGINTFVSSGETSKTFAPIPYAVDDAVDLAYLFSMELGLIRPGKVVLCLSGQPKKSASVRRLAGLLAKGCQRKGADFISLHNAIEDQIENCGPRGMFVFSAATHGFSVDGKSYLVAQDTMGRRRDISALEIPGLLGRIAKASASRQIILFDACREQSVAVNRGSSSSSSHALVDAMENSSGQVILFATSRGGFAYDDEQAQNGVFTKAVIDGLRGKATPDDRFFITAGSLATYVNQQVKDWLNKNKGGASVGGIESRLSGEAANMPLAVNESYKQAMEDYQARRQKAIDSLSANIGQIITGSDYDQVLGRLPSDNVPSKDKLVMDLLKELEYLDDSAKGQRAFMHYFNETFPRLAPKPREPGKRRAELGHVNTIPLLKRLQSRKIWVQGGDPIICERLTDLGLEVKCDSEKRSRLRMEIVILCGTIPHDAGQFLLQYLDLKDYKIRTHEGKSSLMSKSECGQYYEITLRN